MLLIYVSYCMIYAANKSIFAGVDVYSYICVYIYMKRRRKSEREGKGRMGEACQRAVSVNFTTVP